MMQMKWLGLVGVVVAANVYAGTGVLLTFTNNSGHAVNIDFDGGHDCWYNQVQGWGSELKDYAAMLNENSQLGQAHPLITNLLEMTGSQRLEPGTSLAAAGETKASLIPLCKDKTSAKGINVTVEGLKKLSSYHLELVDPPVGLWYLKETIGGQALYGDNYSDKTYPERLASSFCIIPSGSYIVECGAVGLNININANDELDFEYMPFRNSYALQSVLSFNRSLRTQGKDGLAGYSNLLATQPLP